jgi:hypothetical protein
MAKAPAPRLFVILASEAHEAVIIRRWPSAWTHVIRWDMKTDAFTPGAWLRGRIYAERCDLSPNGKLLLYFALQGHRWGTSYSGAYTAVSRSPWLKALALWPELGTWGGGGRFLGPAHVALRSGCVALHPDHAERALTVSTAYTPYHRSTDEVAGADWSGRDHRNRLIFCRDGKLMRGTPGANLRELADLSDAHPDPRPAPDWAAERLQRYGRNPDI